MSINVTVTGNPVSIKNGKMVCCDPNKSQKEFDKRRLLRLEQVRQQSKDIAENVRNKVKKQKCKQLSQVEKEGKEKLKKWQAKKLLELQTQYKEAIRDIGQAHKEALENGDDSDVIVEKTEKNARRSRERGQKAAEKLQVDKNEANFKQALPRQQRKITREIEDTRAAMVSGLCKQGKSPFKKKKKRKQSSREVPVSDDEINNSDYIEDIPKLEIESSSSSSISPDFSYQSSSCLCSQSCSESDEKESEEYVPDKTDAPRRKGKQKDHKQKREEKKDHQPKVETKQQQTSTTFLHQTPSEQKSVQTSHLFEPTHICLEVPKDTRISDRIKSRPLVLGEQSICDRPNKICLCSHFKPPQCICNEKSNKETSNIGINTRQPFSNTQESANDTRDIGLNTRQSLSNKHSQEQINSMQRKEQTSASLLQEEIPSKPKIIVDTSKERLLSQSGTSAHSKVSQYDHNRRFSKEVVDDRSRVEKIPEESIRMSPGADSDIQYYDKVYKRDKDAQIRGQKALEKERIHREYKELLKKLPALQKLERICEISNDKPEYHMSEERLQEKERIRQNKMDNAYEKAFPQRKPAIVTIPPKVHEKVDVDLTPFKTVDESNGVPTLNLGEWDVEARPTKNNVNQMTQEDGTSDNRRTQLKELLESLHNQKRLLLEEIKALPQDSNLAEVLENFSSIGIDITKYKTEKKKKKDSPAREPRGTDGFVRPELKLEDTDIVPKRAVHQSRPRKRSNRLSSPQGREPSDTTEESEMTQSQKSLSRDERSRSRDEKYRKRHEKCFTSEANGSPSPRKKAKTKKYKKHVIVLQNCSTQTTPVVLEEKKTGTSRADKKEKIVDRHDKEVSRKSEASTEVFNQQTNALPEDKSQKNRRSLEAAQSRTEEDDRAAKICTKTHIPCDCNKTNGASKIEDLCQIIIKIKEDDKPEILVQPGDKSSKKVNITKDDINEKQAQPPEFTSAERTKDHRIKEKSIQDKIKSKEQTDSKTKNLSLDNITHKSSDTKRPGKDVKICPGPVDARMKQGSRPKPSRSWKEELSKNSSEDTTTTSYYSPPDFVKKRNQYAEPQAQSTLTDSSYKKQSSNYNDLLKTHPQQGNITDSSTSHSDIQISIPQQKNLDKRLMKYISKLVAMSRKNVDDLGVSTVSEVSTPSDSIINIETNRPMVHLQDILKHYSLNLSDLQQYLSYSTDGSNTKLQGEENLTVSSSDGSQVIPQNTRFQTSLKPSTSERNSSQPPKTCSDSVLAQNALKYSEIAENCNKRISNLTAMIEKVRQEKEQMLLSPTASDPDQSTKYLKLPGFQDHDKSNKSHVSFPPCSHQDTTDSTKYLNLSRSTRKSDSRKSVEHDLTGSSSTSVDEELEKKLLHIDHSLSERLKMMTPDEIKNFEASQKTIKEAESRQDLELKMTESDKQLFRRLQNLLQSSAKTIRDIEGDKSTSPKQKTVGFDREDFTSSGQPATSEQTGNVNFVPLLLDIPKLPKLTIAGSKMPSPLVETGNGRKRPPPSKGLSIVKKFNGDVSAVPHELSTIVEADSQLSTKVDQSPRITKTVHKTGESENIDSDTDRRKKSNVNKDGESPSCRIEKNKSGSAELKDSISVSKDGRKKIDEEKKAIKSPAEKSKTHTVSVKTTDDSKDKSSDSDRSLLSLLQEINESLGISCDKLCGKQIDLSQNILKLSSSSSSEDNLEAVEKVLQSMGMDWAVATLRKTREALALSSSTSSVEGKAKRLTKSKSSASGSDVNLKDFLASTLMSQMSCNTSKSGGTPCSMRVGPEDISAIQGSTEKSNQRTSTPIASSTMNKSDSLQKAIFKNDSDISSVRDNTRENIPDVQNMTFYSL